jgi:hypothetical protein
VTFSQIGCNQLGLGEGRSHGIIREMITSLSLAVTSCLTGRPAISCLLRGAGVPAGPRPAADLRLKSHRHCLSSSFIFVVVVVLNETSV